MSQRRKSDQVPKHFRRGTALYYIVGCSSLHSAILVLSTSPRFLEYINWYSSPEGVGGVLEGRALVVALPPASERPQGRGGGSESLC